MPISFFFAPYSIQFVDNNVNFAHRGLFLELNTKQTTIAGLIPAEPASVFHLKVTSAPAGIKLVMVVVERRPS